MMSTVRVRLAPLALVALLVTAGCLGGIDASTTITGNEQSGSYLSVTRVPQADVQNASDAERAAFKQLSAAKRGAFRHALNRSNVQATAWGSGTDIQYVRYNDTWYQVEVHTV